MCFLNVQTLSRGVMIMQCCNWMASPSAPHFSSHLKCSRSSGIAIEWQ